MTVLIMGVPFSYAYLVLSDVLKFGITVEPYFMAGGDKMINFGLCRITLHLNLRSAMTGQEDRPGQGTSIVDSTGAA